MPQQSLACTLPWIPALWLQGSQEHTTIEKLLDGLGDERLITGSLACSKP
jgi:hypothetical protein